MKTTHWIFIAAASAVCACFILQNHTRAASRLLPFQGRLTDAQGNLIADGARVVQFKIYDAPVGGQAVWNGEVQKLTVNGGLVSTLLGTKANLSSVDFNRDLYLELTIDANNDGQISAADPPLLPRQTVLPVVFAIESADSRLLRGHDWSAIFSEGSSNPATARISGSRLVSSSITPVQIASNSLTAGQLANETIGSLQIAPGAVTRDKLEASLVIDSVIPPGTINAFGGANVPQGWLLCDGRAVSATQFPRLFGAISTNWGGGIRGSTNNFNLPDLRGVFLRGVNNGRSDGYHDLTAANRTNSVPVGNIFTGGFVTGSSGDAVGSLQASVLPYHLHRWAFSTSGTEFTRELRSWDTNGTTRIVLRDFGQPQIVDQSNVQEDNFKEVTPGANNLNLFTDRSSGNLITGGQVAPPNAYVHYIIKY